MDILQNNVVEAKDENGPYFSSMILIQDYCDYVYSPKFEYFGYKVKLVRNIDEPMFSMEVVKPSLIDKSLQKLHKWEKVMRQITQHRAKYDKGTIIDKWEKYNENLRAKPPAKSREIKSVLLDEVLTDESMKEINYDDVKSINSNLENLNQEEDQRINTNFNLNDIQKQNSIQ